MSAGRKSRLRVLVMDDEDCIREMTEEVLEGLGFAADTVRDGSEAIRLFAHAAAAKEPYRAVILDRTVADGEGAMEILPRLKRIDPEVRAIITSGYHNSPEMQQPGKYGFCASLPKPWATVQLREILARAVELPVAVEWMPTRDHLP